MYMFPIARMRHLRHFEIRWDCIGKRGSDLTIEVEGKI